MNDKQVQRSTKGDTWIEKYTECQPLVDEINQHLDKPGAGCTATIRIDVFTPKKCMYCPRVQKSKTETICPKCKVPFK